MSHNFQYQAHGFISQYTIQENISNQSIKKRAATEAAPINHLTLDPSPLLNPQHPQCQQKHELIHL